jgi:hypothetical protein
MLNKIVDIFLALMLLMVSFIVIFIYFILYLVELTIKWGQQCRDYFMGK